jgi:hypothetical protein
MAIREATRPSFWVQPAPAISKWQLAQLAISQSNPQPGSSVFLRALRGKRLFSAPPRTGSPESPVLAFWGGRRTGSPESPVFAFWGGRHRGEKGGRA